MALGSIVLSQLSLRYDRQSGDPILHSVFFYTGSADGARAILSTVATSMIGVGGVVFSMTLVTLSLAAQQFGARTLRALVRARDNQAVLGIFISTFLFCLLFLRQVRSNSDGGEHNHFVPQVSMFIALLFALGGLASLIYFIHRISFVIQAPHIISEAGVELDRAFVARDSARWIQNYDTDALLKMRSGQVIKVLARKTGYLRRIDYEALAVLADSHEAVFEIKIKAGDFIFNGETLLLAFLPKRLDYSYDPVLENDASNAFNFGTQRTQEQDPRFMIGQLLSIALLALSPAINNPIQAILCIYRLAESLRTFAVCPPRGDYLLSPLGRLSVIEHSLTFRELFEASFREIRLNSKTQLTVSLALLDAYKRIGALIESPAIKTTLDEAYLKLSKQTVENFPHESLHLLKLNE
jgi:uncharacterized membrane protein